MFYILRYLRPVCRLESELCVKNRSCSGGDSSLLLINNYPLDIIEVNSWFETWPGWNLGNLQQEIKANQLPVYQVCANYSTLFPFLQIWSCQRDKKPDAKISQNNCDDTGFATKSTFWQLQSGWVKVVDNCLCYSDLKIGGIFLGAAE